MTRPSIIFPHQPITFTSLAIASYRLYITTKKQEIIHLTFVADRQQALKKNIGQQYLTTIPCPDLIRQQINFLLTKETNWEFPATSPFIRAATPFQRAVWQQISLIPRGKTITYGQIAQKIGSPQAAQAVGQACHRNPLALIIPCHRVVGKKALGGFAGDKGIKNYLLGLEQTTLFAKTSNL